MAVKKQNDNSDLAKHLRTIQFSLFVACVGLVALALSETQNDIERAFQDIGRIRELNAAWTSDSLKTHIARVVDNYFKTQNEFVADTLNLKVKGLRRRFAPRSNYGSASLVQQPARDYILKIVTNKMWTLSSPDAHRYSLWDSKLDTLSGIITRWNSLLKQDHAYLVKSLGDSIAYDSWRLSWRGLTSTPDTSTKYALVKISKDSIQSFTAKFYDWQLTADARTHLLVAWLSPFPMSSSEILNLWLLPFPNLEPSATLMGTEGMYVPAHERLRIPVTVEKVKLNVQNELRRLIGAETIWRLGTFDYTFPDLYAFTKNITDLSLQDVETVLDNERKRSGASFEFLGMKLPALFVSRWGILLIIGIQLYFWLHLLTFKNRVGSDDPAWSVPWIALYEGKQSRIVFNITAFILPIVACSTLIVDGLVETKRYLNLWYFIPGLLSSIALSYLASRSMKGVWDKKA